METPQNPILIIKALTFSAHVMGLGSGSLPAWLACGRFRGVGLSVSGLQAQGMNLGFRLYLKPSFECLGV